MLTLADADHLARNAYNRLLAATTRFRNGEITDFEYIAVREAERTARAEWERLRAIEFPGT